jgi:hypothetical protein
MYKVTEEIVRKEMAAINEEMFGSRLFIDDIELDIDFLDTELGYCIDEYGPIEIGLTDEFDDYTQFRTILVHEMIHALQIQMGLDVDHGHYFQHVANYARQTLNLNVLETI